MIYLEGFDIPTWRKLQKILTCYAGIEQPTTEWPWL